MQKTKWVLVLGVSLSVIGVGTALAVASNDDPAPEPPADTVFSRSELNTFDAVEAQLVAIEAFPGFISVASPEGIIGYVKTADLMAQVRVPMGETADPNITLYGASGNAIGVWNSVGQEGWTKDETGGREGK